jgi:hypothetical protein
MEKKNTALIVPNAIEVCILRFVLKKCTRASILNCLLCDPVHRKRREGVLHFICVPVRHLPANEVML